MASSLGDLVYAFSSTVWKRLAGNTTATKKFLRQTGTGAVSAAPAWDTLVASDLPNTAVTPGSYTLTNLTVDAQGRLTAAANGSGGTGTVTNTGTLTANKAIIGNGGVDVTVSAATGVAHLASGTLTGSNVNLATEVTGNLPVANLNSGTSASATTFWCGNATWSTPAGTSNKLAQVVSTLSSAVATGTTGIPLDDTIPQITEGDEYMTLAITPTNASSTLLIAIEGFFSPSAAATLTMALFQDSTANALAAVGVTQSTSGGTSLMVMSYTMTAGTTSATTFRMRASTNSGTLSFNGVAGTRRFGAIPKSSIVITEVLP